MSSAPNSPRPRPNPHDADLLAAGYSRVVRAAELGGSIASLSDGAAGPSPLVNPLQWPAAVPFGDNDGPL